MITLNHALHSQWEVELVGDGYRIRNPKSENYILSPVADVPVQSLRSFRTDDTLVVELPDSLWTIRKVAGEESYLLLVPSTTLAITQTDDPVVNVSLVQTCGFDGIDARGVDRCALSMEMAIFPRK